MKYRVNVVRTAHSFRYIEVDAEDEIEARWKAIDNAGDYEYSEVAVDYECNEITEIEQ